MKSTIPRTEARELPGKALAFQKCVSGWQRCTSGRTSKWALNLFRRELQSSKYKKEGMQELHMRPRGNRRSSRCLAADQIDDQKLACGSCDEDNAFRSILVPTKDYIGLSSAWRFLLQALSSSHRSHCFIERKRRYLTRYPIVERLIGFSTVSITEFDCVAGVSSGGLTFSAKTRYTDRKSCRWWCGLEKYSFCNQFWIWRWNMYK